MKPTLKRAEPKDGEASPCQDLMEATFTLALFGYVTNKLMFLLKLV